MSGRDRTPRKAIDDANARTRTADPTDRPVFGLFAALAILAFMIAVIALIWPSSNPPPGTPSAYAQAYGIPDSLAEMIVRIADEEGIDRRLAFGLVAVESSFRPRAVSSAGAIGLAQVMPATAASLQPGIETERLFEPSTNLRLGFRYLRTLLDRYDDLTEALLAYNMGPGTLARLRTSGRSPATGYPDRVLRAAARSGAVGR
ncbi:MAG: lytic transglycosylase domain-containing protein [Gemmatimonadota bacterium]